jgi:hypothetical protein
LPPAERDLERSILLIAAFPFRRRAPEAAWLTVCGTPKWDTKKVSALSMHRQRLF